MDNFSWYRMDLRGHIENTLCANDLGCNLRCGIEREFPLCCVPFSRKAVERAILYCEEDFVYAYIQGENRVLSVNGVS